MMYRQTLVWAVTMVLLLPACRASDSAVKPNMTAIANVSAGKISEARASWWGYDPANATKHLQAAIDSGVSTLIVDHPGSAWIVEPIKLRSNQEIIFEQGVEVLAKAGAFKGRRDSLFTAELERNITLSGYGATLRMRRTDYDGDGYEKAEWRHILHLRSCTNVTIRGLALVESGGDGIYLGTARDSIPNTNVLIKDVICDRNYRQGISVINAENLLIEDTLIQNTGGTAPQSGVDFEPNHATERLVNCVMRNCTTRGNRGYGVVFALAALNADSRPISVRLENCTSIEDHAGSFRFDSRTRGDAAVTGTAVFHRCISRRSPAPGFFIVDKPVDGCEVTISDTIVENAASAQPTQAPIVFLSRSGAPGPLGGVEFRNVVVRDRIDRAPVKYVDGGGVPLTDISGDITIQHQGKQERVRITRDIVSKWMPHVAFRAISRVPTTKMQFKPVARTSPRQTGAIRVARFRYLTDFVTYATQGQDVRFTLKHEQMGNYSGNLVTVEARSPSGAVVVRTTAKTFAETRIAFTAPETGAYRLQIDAGRNRAQIAESSHAMLLSSENKPIQFFRSPGDYFIWVPENTREFGVRVYGEGVREGVKATLIDPSGAVLDEVDNTAQSYQFEVSLPAGARGQAWTLRLARPSKMIMEDHFVDIRGIPPLLAPSKDALLMPVE